MNASIYQVYSDYNDIVKVSLTVTIMYSNYQSLNQFGFIIEELWQIYQYQQTE
jgi:hypothetical protein